MRGYDFKGFYLPDLLKECNELPTLTEQIDYLETALEEWEINPPELDLNGEIDPPFEKRLQIEINRRRRNIEIDKVTNTVSMQNGIVKITARYGIADITRIFEAMKKAEIIDSKTESPQIAKIFFEEQIEKVSFQRSYNARKNDVKRGVNSYSEELLKFIKVLIKDSYSKKDEELLQISEFINKLLNKRIY